MVLGTLLGALLCKKVADKLPNSLPPPEDFGLVHEYYTPAKVYRAVSAAVARLRSRLGVFVMGAPRGIGQGHIRTVQIQVAVGRVVMGQSRCR